MKYLIKTLDNYYMISLGISTENKSNAKKFKTYEDAEKSVEKIRSQAEWMKIFKCEIVEVVE